MVPSASGSALLLAPVGLPLLLALLLLLPGVAGRRVLSVAPWAALPAVTLALAIDVPPALDLAWLLLGAQLELDLTGRMFLLLTGLLWLLGGLFAARYMATDPARRRFFLFFLLAMAGSIGMVLAQDIVSFYLLFALMTFAAYPLVNHAGTREARRAGRIYLAMAVVGETMLLVALLLVAHQAPSLMLVDAPAAVAQSPWRDATILLLLGGFGIKIGAVPLHVWLPLAHPVAPTPASAVLSGAMIKAGLLGWLRFLPLGLAELDGWGGLLIALGLGAAFFGVAIGLTQRDPKIALAYSSISQMGLINIGVGAGLSEPAAWAAGEQAALVYALHHGLAKGALFLGVGVAAATAATGRARGLLLGALALPAISLAGAPLTSGAVAKISLKQAAGLAPPPWELLLDILLPVAAIGTTLLMLRVLTTLPATRAGHSTDRWLWLPWLALLAAVASAALLYPAYLGQPLVGGQLLDVGELWLSSWPILVGAFLYVVFSLSARLAGAQLRPIVAGDLLVPFERAAAARFKPEPVAQLPAPAHPVATLGSRWYGLLDEPAPGGLLSRLEAGLSRWSNAGLLFVALALVLAGVLLWR